MAAGSFKRALNHIRWVPFAFIVSLVTYAFLVSVQVHIAYTIRRKHAYVSSIFNIAITTLLCGMTLWCFIVAVFRHPGMPAGSRSREEVDERQTSTSVGESRWAKRERQREQDEEREIASRAERGDDEEREEEVGDDDDEEDLDGRDSGDEAPLLNSAAFSRRSGMSREEPSTSALDGGAGLIPGQPRMPSRTERAQLDDVMGKVERAKRECKADGSGKVYLGGLQVKNTGEKRWCNKCDCEKPDRAHHCSSCGVCILRMDHHCPWLASRCIGLRNHKAFFLFLCYTALLCAFVAQDLARVLVQYVEEEKDVSGGEEHYYRNQDRPLKVKLTFVPCRQGFETSPLAWAILGFIGFIFGLALIPFASYHAYLICRNRTTLESMEGAGRVRISVPPSTARRREDVSDRLRKLAGSSLPAVSSTRRDNENDGWKRDEQLTREERRALKKANRLNIYDVGIHENWRAVMGDDWRKWMVPTGEPESDGYSYHINTDTLQRLEDVTSSIRGGGGQKRRENDEGASSLHSPTVPSPQISTVRGKARMQRQHSDSSQRASSHRSVSSSGHGLVEWGAPPKKDFVLYGLNDDEDDDANSGGVLRHSNDVSNANIRRTSPKVTTREEQMDADLWS